MNYFEKLIIKKEMVYMLNWLKVHGPHAAALVLGVTGFLLPALKDFVATHPSSTLATLCGIIIAVYNMTAPKDQGVVQSFTQKFGGNVKPVVLLAVSLLVLSAARPALAQNAPLATSNFTTNFTALNLPGKSTTFVGTAVDLGVSFTPGSNLFLETVQAPTVAGYQGYYGPGFGYQLNGLSKWINNISPNLSGYKFRFTVTASGGIARISTGNHVAGNARFRTEYSLGSTGIYNMLFEIGAGRLYTAPGWQPLFAAGGALHF